MTAPTFTERDAETISELTTYMKRMAVLSVSVEDPDVTVALLTLGAALLDGISIHDGVPVGTLVPELVGMTDVEIINVSNLFATFSGEQMGAAQAAQSDGATETALGLSQMALSFYTVSILIETAYL